MQNTYGPMKDYLKFIPSIGDHNSMLNIPRSYIRNWESNIGYRRHITLNCKGKSKILTDGLKHISACSLDIARTIGSIIYTQPNSRGIIIITHLLVRLRSSLVEYITRKLQTLP